MAETKTMSKRMFIVFALVFLFGGIEYAVILPTLWLYLQNTYNAPEYMFGIVLSAYSLAAILVSPVLGRVVDRLRCTKQIFIICAMFELVGSFLYFIGISQWLCVASRFISGLGASGEAIALAEVSRYTTDAERTSILSTLVAIRQLSLLAAPGLNVVLRLADFKIGPFEVNKYSSPGAFMTVMWTILIFLVLVIYKNPSKGDTGNKASQNHEAVIAPEDDTNGDIANDDPNAPLLPTSATNRSQSYHSIDQTESKEQSCDEDEKKSLQHREPPDFLGSSYDILVSAEVYMQSADFEYENHVSADLQEDDFFINENHFAPPSPSSCLPSLQGKGAKVIDEEYVVKTQSAFDDDPVHREGKLNFFYNEYVRHQIVALLMLIFCSTFSQVCLETMFTPLSQLYMDFGELENSILYCLCGVVVIIAFVMVSKCSKCVTDRNLILFGSIMLLMTNIGLILFLPQSPTHNRDRNLPIFSVMVFFDVLSLPFLFVCATSLFSKLTRKETQGLNQGIRRSFVGLGTILAPLWASSSVKQLYIMLGVMIAIQTLSMFMCLLSYKRLKVPSPTSSIQNETALSAQA